MLKVLLLVLKVLLLVLKVLLLVLKVIHLVLKVLLLVLKVLLLVLKVLLLVLVCQFSTCFFKKICVSLPFIFVLVILICTICMYYVVVENRSFAFHPNILRVYCLTVRRIEG